MTAWVSGAAAAKGQQKAPETKPSSFSFWRLLRWAFLLVLVLVIVQMLRRPAPPAAVQRTPQERAADAASFRSKLDGLERAHRDNMRGAEARFTEDELNGYIQQSVAEGTAALTDGLSSQAARAPGGSSLPSAAGAAESAASKAPSVLMQGDEIKVQMLVERFGKDFTFSLSGKLGSDAGYATFHPTSCKLGLVSIPLGLVDGVVQRKLAEPANREKMKLPDFIQSVRIENGELVVVEK